MTPTIIDLVARLAIVKRLVSADPAMEAIHSATLAEAASALQAQATALRLCATMAGNSAYNLCHATGTVEDAIRSFEQIETTALRATREGGE